MSFPFRDWLSAFFRPDRSLRSKARVRARPWLEWLEERWVPTVFTVTDNSNNPADTGSLIYALNHLAAGGNTIDFNITGSTTINAINLPAITKQVTVDGLTQGGSGYNGPPLVVLNGNGSTQNPDCLGFEPGSNGSIVDGLVIQDYPGDGIVIDGTSHDLIYDNYIGTDITGAIASGNDVGVFIGGGATANTIGGTTAGNGNVISANTSYGVWLGGNFTSHNVVLGNKIGTDVTGTAALGNRTGVFINYGAMSNTIGGTITGSANVISGNSRNGVYLSGPFRK